MSNTIIESMMNHRSVRRFTDKAIDATTMEAILRAAQQAPNSVNGQQTSLVVIRDKERLAKIAELCGGQPQVATANAFVVVVADFNRTEIAIKHAGGKQVFDQGIEAVITGAVDAGITVEALTVASESFGLGTVVIGGIRQNLQAVIDLLELPAKTFPVIGLSMGYPDTDFLPSVKPRIELVAYAFDEKYTKADFIPFIKNYDEVVQAYWEKAGVPLPNYSTGLNNYYGKEGRMETTNVLKAQGFGLK